MESTPGRPDRRPVRITRSLRARYARAVRGIIGQWVFRTDAAGAGSAEGTLVERILAARGIRGQAESLAFLDPRLVHLHDPSLMPDMDRAAERILASLRRGGPVVIYGDYDVDGITATTILFHTMRTIAPGADVRTYVPHRLEEGYGLNAAAIDELASQGADLIVSVDCGITARGPADVAAQRGLDLIITDHHNPPASDEDLPRAYAIVHPRRPGSQYPFGDLSGAGVAYKLAWRLATMHCGSQRVTPDLRTLLVELLPFAALGTIADVVPLLGENRVFARYGLERMRCSPFVGLRALVEAAGLAESDLGEMDVGFRLGPRLNAAGRMGHAKDAVELFTVADEARAREIAQHLTRQNDARRAVENEIFRQAVELAEASGMTGPDKRAIVLVQEGWHAGVVGIVCSRLVERYSRPVILMQCRQSESGVICAGSGRSVPGFNLHAGLQACEDLLEKYGGHDMAAGLHLRMDNMAAFTERFIAYANERIAPEDLVPRVEVDVRASLDELTPETVGQIERLAPFGRDNPPVRLLVPGLQVAFAPRLLGAHGKHLQVTVRPRGREQFGNGLLRLVAWGWGERLGVLTAGMPMDAVIEPKLNRWNGQVRVEAELKDAAPAPA
jgi:single-stranded-DNA-specific exonuclease